MADIRTFRPLSKATWGIYLFFVAMRVFFAFQPGYIHPDEYFQNAEITAAVVLAMCITVLCSIVNDVEASSSTKGIRAFTRITFVLYGFPLGLTFLFVIAKAIMNPSPAASPTHPTSSASALSSSNSSVGKATIHFCVACFPLALGIVLGVTANIVLDSLFFEKLHIVHAATQQPIARWVEVLDPRAWKDLRLQGTLTVTFINNLLYNLDKDNLAEHGLHPLYLHLLVNFPVLFSNLAYVGVKAIGEKVVLQKQIFSQSTLVTGIYHMSRDGNTTFITHTIFYKTYMPPYHLFGLNEKDADSHGIRLEISDWRNETREGLIHALSQVPAAKDPDHRRLVDESFAEDPTKALFFESAPGIYRREVLIAPSTVDLSDQPFYNTRLSFTPHANLDHMDIFN
ncbi:hypothetical protein BGZ73_009115 [Actinomortierella ambigua]|nr:hypothetical protein BGZ73_009115 [Actinomortierella ambigua]